MKPHADDSPPIAVFRSAIYHDHFQKRVTLEQSLKNPLHVLMHLLDPRFGQILFLDSSHSFSLFAYAADIVFSDF